MALPKVVDLRCSKDIYRCFLFKPTFSWVPLLVQLDIFFDLLSVFSGRLFFWPIKAQTFRPKVVFTANRLILQENAVG